MSSKKDKHYLNLALNLAKNMEGLKELDPVAYVRFASVYRNFREEKDFVQFVDKIDVFKKR